LSRFNRRSERRTSLFFLATVESSRDHVGFSADAEAKREIGKAIHGEGVTKVEVMGVEDQRDLVVAGNAERSQFRSEGPQIACVTDEKLVLIELNFHGAMSGNYGDARATVVCQQVFVFAEVTFEDGTVDVVAAKFATPFVAAMARLEDDVDSTPEWSEQAQKRFEESLAGNGGGQDGDAKSGIGATVVAEAIALAKGYRDAGRGSNGGGQAEGRGAEKRRCGVGESRHERPSLRNGSHWQGESANIDRGRRVRRGRGEKMFR
jgi:hypothetical protein